jgi:hypothetical protein
MEVLPDMAQINPAYKELAADDSLSLNSDLEQVRPRSSLRPRVSTVILSILTSIFALLSIYQSHTLSKLRVVTQRPSSIYLFQEGYSTELTAPKGAIDIKTVAFTGDLKYNATDGTLYWEVDPGTPQYAGEPSPEIDQNWVELLAGQYLVFSEEEAMQFDNPVRIEDYYFGE